MTDLHSSNGRRRSSVSIAPDDLVVDSVLTLDEGEEEAQITTPTTTPRAKRSHDYRLRGLDLEAQKKGQAPTPPVRKNQLRLRHRRRLLLGWVTVVVVVAGVALLLRATVIEPFSVPSAAMEPTLHVGDRILVVKSTSLAGPIQTGSIIVFRHPEPYPCRADAGSGPDVVQRVIGLPGQTIWSVGNTIYVDGNRVNDFHRYGSSVGAVTSDPIPLTTVPAGEYFVMGDNRSQSCDSRSFGAVPASSIVGKVVSIVLRGGHPYVHVF
jgi:signal peptidase I